MTRSGLPVSLAAGSQYAGAAALGCSKKAPATRHAHVFGPPDIFPYDDERRYNAAGRAGRALPQHAGGSPASAAPFFVCPTAHGYDNRVILDAIGKLGDSARGGIANIDASFEAKFACPHWRRVASAAARFHLMKDPARAARTISARICRCCGGSAGFSFFTSIPRISSSMSGSSGRSRR